MNFASGVLHALGLPPLGLLSSLFAFYVHASIILGKFPVYGNPDPKTLAIYAFYAPLVHGTGALWLYSMPVWLILSIGYATSAIMNRRSVSWKPLVKVTLIHLLAIALFLSPIAEWFAD